MHIKAWKLACKISVGIFHFTQNYLLHQFPLDVSAIIVPGIIKLLAICFTCPLKDNLHLILFQNNKISSEKQRIRNRSVRGETWNTCERVRWFFVAWIWIRLISKSIEKESEARFTKRPTLALFRQSILSQRWHCTTSLLIPFPRLLLNKKVVRETYAQKHLDRSVKLNRIFRSRTANIKRQFSHSKQFFNSLFFFSVLLLLLKKIGGALETQLFKGNHFEVMLKIENKRDFFAFLRRIFSKRPSC